MSRQRFKIPAYRHQKSRGLAVVRIDGHDEYLGAYGSVESKAEYQRLISDWLRKKGSSDPSPLPPVNEITIIELVDKYITHVKEYYRKPDGTPTGEDEMRMLALRPVIALYPTLKVVDFGPVSLKRVREEMIRRDWSRKHINQQISRVKSMFRWGVENELIPPSVYHGLQAVRGLSRGRSEARETDPVEPVPIEYVDAVKPFVSNQVWGMIQLQLLTGMRPGEVVIIRGCDIQTDDGALVWTYTPSSHKTEHHGKQRKIKVGPKGQEIIKQFLKPDLQAYLFCPNDAETERGRTHDEKRKRHPRDRYDVHSYRRAIARGCMKADRWMKGGKVVANDEILIPKWNPHRLRHSTATLLRQKFGIEASRVVLGHSSPAITEVYCAIDENKATEIMSQIG